VELVNVSVMLDGKVLTVIAKLVDLFVSTVSLTAPLELALAVLDLLDPTVNVVHA
jgi:hypothetical protein